MGTLFLHEYYAGVELDYVLKMPGSHIPCMGTLFLHEYYAGVELDYPLKLPGGHIPCMDTSFLHVLSPGDLQVLLYLMSDDHMCHRYILYYGANCCDES